MMNNNSENINEKLMHEEEFIRGITSTLEGQRVLSCIQCGTCTATCPVSKIFGHSPRQLFLMIRNGQKKEVLNDITPWVCASCYKCTVNCPAQIKITEVMYRLKRLAIKNNLVNKKTDTRQFYTAFMSSVMKYGRSYEVGLMLKYLMLNHPGDLIRQMPLGIKMFMDGALPVLPHKIKNLNAFEKIISHAIKLEKEELLNN